MAKRSPVQSDATLQGSNPAQLVEAYRRLESVLETVDLDEEPELADALIDAVSATERAYVLETEEEERN
jgi:hypothetical protein